MTLISLPQDDKTVHRRLSFYLAMEEYVARELKQFDECFFAWQVEPTVIFGRNQQIESEVNLEYCKSHGIDTIRRKSGGGCVYADLSNVMFSYINTGWDVTCTFDHYISLTVEMLRSLGVDAIGSSRNDIMIDGRKVSGNAFYHIPGRNIVHGTMLYDTDMQNMVSAITPSNEKLVSKGVESVRQHICLLKYYIGNRMSVTEFRDYACNHMCDSEYVLTADEVKKIEVIQQEYHDEQYILGHNPGYYIHNHRRIEGVGEFDMRIDVKNNIIKGLNLTGDFFVVGDLNELLKKFKGTGYQTEALSAVLDGVDTSEYIMGLSKEQMLGLLIEEQTTEQ